MFKRINIDDHEKIEIPDLEIKGESVVFSEEKKWEYNDIMYYISTIIYPLQDTANRYGLEFDTIVQLIYINNLVIFQDNVKVHDRRIRAFILKNEGYIREDFSSSKHTYYRLTEGGLEIVKYFYESLKNTQGFISENRVMEKDTMASLKTALANYFLPL